MLREPYYIGISRYKGERYTGWHEPLIPEELFNRVQALLHERAVSDELHREHHHYLKGSLFCADCYEQRGRIRRMVIQHAIGRSGIKNIYFFCTGTKDGSCTALYSNIERVEQHYQSIRLATEFLAELRSAMAKTMASSEQSIRLQHQQVTK